MADKENKGGLLSNEQVEQDNRVKGKASEGTEAYIGSQDTGDKNVRQFGSDVQRQHGHPADEKNGES